MAAQPALVDGLVYGGYADTEALGDRAYWQQQIGPEDTRPPQIRRNCLRERLYLMQSAAVSRSQAYRMLQRGLEPFKVFAGVRYIRGEDIAAVAQNRIASSPGPRRPPP